jgi:cytochrome P450
MPVLHQDFGSPHSDGKLPVQDGRLLDFPEDPGRCMLRLHERFGDIAALREGDQQLVFVFGPHYVQEVLSDADTYHSRFFAIRGPRQSAQRRLTCGLMSMNGEDFKRHRRLVMGPFQKKVIPTYHDSICQLARELVESWQPGDVRDLHDEMTQYMLRVTCGLLFGLDHPELAYEVGRMIGEWVDMNHETGMLAFVPDAKLNDSYDRLLELGVQLESAIVKMVEMRRSAATPGGDVLSLLIQANDETGAVSNDELIGQIALLYGAAHLTTANTLTWTQFLLAQHPSIARRLLEETSQIRGDAPTLDEVAKLPLTERVIKESMRLLPASSYSQRISAHPVRLGPFDLKRGTPVIFSQFITQRSTDQFTEPRTFHPDRWETISPSPYQYFPFGAGPRMCLGAPLAMLTMKTTLTMIFNRFRLSVVAGAKIDAQIVSTMLSPTTSVPVRIAAQDGQFQSSPVAGRICDLVDLPEVDSARRDIRRAA